MSNPNSFFSDETTREQPSQANQSGPEVPIKFPTQQQAYSPTAPDSREAGEPLEAAGSVQTNQEEAPTVRFAIGKLKEYLQWFIVVLEVTLLIRFFLKLIGANPENIFAGFIYALTDIVLYPFSNIVASPSLAPNQAIEFFTLIGMFIYGLIFYAIQRFLTILIYEPDGLTAVDTSDVTVIRTAINSSSSNNNQQLPQTIIRRVRAAINGSSSNDNRQLATAIIHRIGATDEKSIEDRRFISKTVWEITLPSIGLRLDTGKAIFFLREMEKSNTFYQHLLEIKKDTRADFLLLTDYVEVGQPLPLFDPGIVWLKPENLNEMIETPRDKVIAWLGRLIACQVTNFEDLIRYHTEGSADFDIFFGRDYELQRLTSGTAKGGIIVGAHKSGKTSLLMQLSERLNNQHYVVGGPYTIHSTNVRTFMYDTLRELDIDGSGDISLEAWASILREQSREGKRMVLLLDEVDILLDQDAKTGFNLGHELRALQNDGHCKFYLAGHNKLREAIALEGGPFRNFAEEITLRGLDKSAGTRLIREPIGAIGFTVNAQQAQQIFEGTAGVAVLIQGFCRRLLLTIHRSRDSDIPDTAIQRIEEDPEYLNMVFDYYEYAQTWASTAVMLVTAQLKEASRPDIIQVFSQYDVKLPWDELDNLLEFLIRFGVLEEFKPGRYQILSKYLYRAIEARSGNSEAFLVAQLEKGRRRGNG